LSSLSSKAAQDPLLIHRREIAAHFLDLRAFMAFADQTEPEEVIEVLQEYHHAVAGLIAESDGTLERFTGDGIMIFFNDPVPVPDLLDQALPLAMNMRERIDALGSRWHSRGYDLALGMGIAMGDATIGAIGFEGRWDYAAISRVPDLAVCLCSEAQSGQALINQSSLQGMEHRVTIESVGDLLLKGFQRPVPVVNILDLDAAQIPTQH